MDNTSSTSRALNDDRWRTLLQVISAVVAVEIALHSFIVKEPMLTLAGAALWIGAGVFWTRRGGNGGPFTIGFLATFEILATLFFSEEFADQADVANWILVLHVVLVAAAVIAVIKTVTGARGSMRHATSS
ncbi:MAG: hypothetical protein ACRDKF_01715 [Actinomycetota bacterium]